MLWIMELTTFKIFLMECKDKNVKMFQKYHQEGFMGLGSKTGEIQTDNFASPKEKNFNSIKRELVRDRNMSKESKKIS